VRHFRGHHAAWHRWLDQHVWCHIGLGVHILFFLFAFPAPSLPYKPPDSPPSICANSRHKFANAARHGRRFLGCPNCSAPVASLPKMNVPQPTKRRRSLVRQGPCARSSMGKRSGCP
jgi:hypothetical protein